ncbi:MAG: DNA polymerase/3'-5' exonuclease PolX [Methanobacteriota archaeon]|nr:MAG: DNA polymerase/3'-5' exonuclease PolX [Euryarchaeota archaeon]
MQNSYVASVFYEIAALLELQGVAFKPQAYRRAASAIEQLEIDIAAAVEAGTHRSIPGVGDAIAKKIEELVETGKLDYLDRLRSETPPGLLEVMAVPDMGPKSAMKLYRELGISSLDELKRAAESGKISRLKGFGERADERILRGIQTLESKGSRALLGEAVPIAKDYLEYMKNCVSPIQISICGSLRRGKETIGDVDLLVGSTATAAVTKAFTEYELVDEVVASGTTKTSVRLAGGFQVDLRVIDPNSFGAALQYFTGSKEHNVLIRKLGMEKGLKVNEYGVFERDNDAMLAGGDEEGVYEALGLPWIAPELREDSGEIDAARHGRLPRLVDTSEINGDFHVHTDWSDGSETIDDIVTASKARGYDYVAITDHTQSLTIANGLSPTRVRRQIKAVRQVEKAHEGSIRVFAGTEVDILADGSLDLPSDVLKELDIVIASVHSRLKMAPRELTTRVVTAIESGLVDILGHPTGRIIGRREASQMNLEKVLEAAEENGVAMEINSFPDRLDLRDAHCRLAKDRGVMMAIGTDSHSVRHLDYLGLGIITARRGWLEKGNVMNTLETAALEKLLRGRRS